mgnify:CR=1 FL=1
MGNYKIENELNKLLKEMSKKYEPIKSDDFKIPVFGIKYLNKELNSPFPLGGIGTGYIEIKPDGNFGKTTINNEFIQPFKIDSPFCSIKFEEIEFPLIADGKIVKKFIIGGIFHL